MALQVWLPLLGNLDNQGISNITFSEWHSNVTVPDNNGKIGKCYINSSHANGGLISNSPITIGPAQSMFCWFKFTDLEAASNLGGGLVNMHRYSKNTGMGITIRYVSATTGYLSVNTGTGSSRTYNTYYGTTLLQANTWYHGGFTYDGTNVLKIYVNGICEKTVNIGQMSCPEDYMTVFCWSTAGSSGKSVHNDYKFQGSINDVRVYDHALSPKEIEILARGLVVHYPMIGGGRGQDNLLKNTGDLTKWNKENGITVSWDNDKNMYKIEDSSHTTSRWGIYQDFSVQPNTTYTVSCTLLGDYSGCGFGVFDTSAAWPGETIIYKNSTIKSRLTYTLTSGANSSIARVYISTNCGTSKVAWCTTPKVEVGSKSTSWIPNSADAAYTTMGYNDNIEYDVSGYNYHGTKIGSPIYSSDTPKYSISTSFNGVDNCIQVPLNTFFPNAGSFTINLWFKKHELGSKNYETVFGGISGFEMDTRNSSSTTLSYYVTGNNRGLTVQSPLNFDTWYMLTMVCDGTNELYYLNGEYKTQIAKKSMPTGNYFIGAWNSATQQNFKGLVSDFRVYATALSATQVADLYNTSMSVTNNGTLLEYELVET